MRNSQYELYETVRFIDRENKPLRRKRYDLYAKSILSTK